MAYTPFSNCLRRTVERKISFKGKFCVSCAEGAKIFCPLKDFQSAVGMRLYIPYHHQLW